jgi:diguanylate cyclase (GGDEF)-like protein
MDDVGPGGSIVDRRRIRQESLRQVLPLSRSLVLTGPLGMVLMLVVVRPDWVTGTVWALLTLVPSVVILLLTPPALSALPALERWEHRYRVYLIVDLLAWASAIPLMRPAAGHASEQTAQLLVLVAIANTLVLIGAFLPRLVRSVIVIYSAVVMVSLLVWGIGFNRFLAVFVPLYAVLLLQMQQHMRVATERSMRLALENEVLLRELGHDHDRLEHQARHDHLTGVLNRSAFLELVGMELDVARTASRTPAVAFLDLDHFKRVNDLHGHLVGDRLLVQVCERIRGAVRDDDLVGRYGGDEFTVFFRAADDDSARRAGERIVAAFERPFRVDDLDLQVGISVGIAMGMDPAITAEDLISLADASLYRAKAQGRHRVEVARAAGHDR